MNLCCHECLSDLIVTISSLAVFLTDAHGLTEAIHNTGRVYEEIGNMHGEQVGSVLVYRAHYMYMDGITLATL